MRICYAILLAARATCSLSARNWLTAGQPKGLIEGAVNDNAEGQWNLGLLPFPMEEALLPGETKQVHLFEARFLQLFTDAAENHDCLGAMLFTPGGNIAAVSTLLEVEEFRREDVGVWARLKCVGRIKLRSVSQTDYQYVNAEVEPVFDARRSGAAGGVQQGAVAPSGEQGRVAEDASAAAAQVREMHASVLGMRRKLSGSEGGEGGEGRADDRVEWGHELRVADADADVPLDDLIATRGQVLKSRGMDAMPMASLSQAIAPVWGTQDEDEAERQLLSFASASTLPASERLQALGMSDTTERLAHVASALRAQQQRLAAMLALRSTDL